MDRDGFATIARGQQLDGPQGNPLVNGGGELRLDGLLDPSGWNAWQNQISAGGPGCFGLQLDGTNFTEIIVFRVLAGPRPSG
jgi:hypothetical protein